MSETKVAFKGFDKNMSCRNHKFEVGQKYRYEGEVVICQSGFHACSNAMDVWSYYKPGESRYAQVEQFGKIVNHTEDSKLASSDIHIIKELSEKEFIQCIVSQMMELTVESTANTEASSGDNSQQASSGYNSKQASSGNYSKQASSGDNSQLECNGNNSVIACSGTNNVAKGVIGTWISLAEFNENNKCIGFAVGCIGQDGLLSEIWYKAKNGKLVPNE